MPEPVVFYPLSARYKAAEKENRQPKGILGDVAITYGPYNEPGGAYMFRGTDTSYILFPNDGVLNTPFSITLMCWVQPEGRNGLLFSYGDPFGRGFRISIVDGKFSNEIVKIFPQPLTSIVTAELLPAGKWVHVAASYDHNSGNNSLYINGHFSGSQNIGKTTVQMLEIRSFLGSSFKGKIAEMKVYDVALNGVQIQTSIRQGS